MITSKISIVVPSYNEEKHILPLYERLTKTLQKITTDYEIVYVNNGSRDGSDRIFEELAARDNRVIVLCLSRNFGSQGAHTAGLSVATGEVVVCMDGDLQDPPEVIESFVQKWKEGYDVVYGVRARRKGSRIMRFFYWIFYRLLNRYSYVDIPLDAGDFALMDKKVVHVLNSMPEKDRFMRGLRAYAGFRQIGVDYVRDDRQGDRPRYGFIDNFKLAYRWFFAFSYSPLQLIMNFGIITAMLALLGICYYLYIFIVFHDAPPGWMTLTCLVLLLGSIQLLSLSIIGGYVARMFEEIKDRPSYIIARIINQETLGTPQQGNAPNRIKDGFPNE